MEQGKNEFDNRLMEEHIKTHEALISKLVAYKIADLSEDLKKVLNLHIGLLEKHIDVMKQLMNNEEPDDLKRPIYEPIGNVKVQERYKVMDGIFMAKSLGLENYQSAFKMKGKRTKEIHLLMSIQTFHLMRIYEDLLTMLES